MPQSVIKLVDATNETLDSDLDYLESFKSLESTFPTSRYQKFLNLLQTIPLIKYFARIRQNNIFLIQYDSIINFIEVHDIGV